MPAPQDDDESRMAHYRVFSPILAGATFGERLFACLGALVGICITGMICAAVLGSQPELPLIVAPMGATAVLLFAVPASPLAQPWPIIAGHTISALVGVAMALLIDDTRLGVGLAVGLAILAMSLTRSLHPPGGATALTAVIGGAAIKDAALWFPFIPVAINSLALVVCGLAFHRLSGHQYPHRPKVLPENTHLTKDPPSSLRVGFTTNDVDAALLDLNETLDIDRADIVTLLRQVEHQALLRSHGSLKCQNIMSRDVIDISAGSSSSKAQELLLRHNVRLLPVVDNDGELLGTVGLRELAMHRDCNSLPTSKAIVAYVDDAVVGLLPQLTDGHTHAAVILDQTGSIAGIITQTDLLAALARSLLFVPNQKHERLTR
jgi:CBS domain-containing membrane protein